MDAKYHVRQDLAAAQILFDSTMFEAYRINNSPMPKALDVAAPEDPRYRQYVEDILSAASEAQAPLTELEEQLRTALYAISETPLLADGISPAPIP